MTEPEGVKAALAYLGDHVKEVEPGIWQLEVGDMFAIGRLLAERDAAQAEVARLKRALEDLQEQLRNSDVPTDRRRIAGWITRVICPESRLYAKGD